MVERSRENTYQLPGSHESSINDTLQTPLSEVDLARAAIEQAVSAHDIDPQDIDIRRVETLGAAAAHGDSTGERYFNPTDISELLAVGHHVIALRNGAIDSSSAKAAA